MRGHHPLGLLVAITMALICLISESVRRYRQQPVSGLDWIGYLLALVALYYILDY